MSFAAAEGDRRAANTIQIGTVTSVNAGAARARVQFGDVGSPELPVGQLRAGALSFWWMPTPGEQVLVACPSGDIARGVIVCSIFAGNAPSSDAGTPEINLAGGTIKIDGDMHITGTISSDADVIASGISLTTHEHTGVRSGSSNTGGPV